MNKPDQQIFPDNVRSIAVVSAAGAASHQDIENAVSLLRSYGIKVSLALPERSIHTPSYLAADAAARIEFFNRAANDPTIDMILCVRGGFGSMHMLEQIDYAALRRRNLPVMGYSDITALHCAMLANHAGTPIAGSNLLSLHQVQQNQLSIQSHYAALDNSATAHHITLPDALQSVIPAANIQVTAKASACNLTVLTALCGTPFMPDFSGRILILEDINEPVYKLDRMLTQLALNGVFDHIAALIFGSFSGNDVKQSDLDLLMKRIASEIAAPCLKNFPFGHTFPMCAVNGRKKLSLAAGQSALLTAAD